MSEAVLRQCYNRGCGDKYKSAENKQDSCTYHPGAPFFHDAYKGWSCCKKKTVDFTEFLNTKGCTRGFHSDVKPPEPEKPAKRASPGADEQIFSPQTPNRKLEAPAPRPDFDTPMVDLSCTVSASLKQALQKQALTSAPAADASQSGGPAEVAPGTPCQRGGCGQVYGSCSLECVHHPGGPIFHEGMKYWSCCQRKTSDFTAFLSQVGCSTGDHLWVKKKEGDSRRTSCRYDWHQTGSHVTVAVYAKLCRPDQCRVQASAVRLRPHLVFGDQQLFEVDLELAGLVDPAASRVSLMGTKVEIVLKKAEPRTWSQLSLPRAAPVPVPDSTPAGAGDQLNGAAEDVTQRVEAVDLSDL